MRSCRARLPETIYARFGDVLFALLLLAAVALAFAKPCRRVPITDGINSFSSMIGAAKFRGESIV